MGCRNECPLDGHRASASERYLPVHRAELAEYAKRMVDRVTGLSQQIGSFPQSGRPVPEHQMEQIREVVEGPYRIIYCIKPDQIDGLAVVHHASLGVISL